jgi:hypothetical protein
VIDYTSSKNESLGYHFGQFVASVGKLRQSGTVGYGNGEREEKGIVVVTPSLVAGIITDSPTKEFTMPEAE